MRLQAAPSRATGRSCSVGAGGDPAVQRGGALYAARVSESAPQVVYSASLEEVEDEAQGSLKININTADVDDLDELPQVGPATTETIIEYRRTNGMFRSVDEFASMRTCKSVDLTFRALLTGSVARVTVARSRVSIGSRTPLTP